MSLPTSDAATEALRAMDAFLAQADAAANAVSTDRDETGSAESPQLVDLRKDDTSSATHLSDGGSLGDEHSIRTDTSSASQAEIERMDDDLSDVDQMSVTHDDEVAHVHEVESSIAIATTTGDEHSIATNSKGFQAEGQQFDDDDDSDIDQISVATRRHEDGDVQVERPIAVTGASSDKQSIATNSPGAEVEGQHFEEEEDSDVDDQIYVTRRHEEGDVQVERPIAVTGASSDEQSIAINSPGIQVEDQQFDDDESDIDVDQISVTRRHEGEDVQVETRVAVTGASSDEQSISTNDSRRAQTEVDHSVDSDAASVEDSVAEMHTNDQPVGTNELLGGDSDVSDSAVHISPSISSAEYPSPLQDDALQTLDSDPIGSYVTDDPLVAEASDSTGVHDHLNTYDQPKNLEAHLPELESPALHHRSRDFQDSQDTPPVVPRRRLSERNHASTPSKSKSMCFVPAVIIYIMYAWWYEYLY
jgi:hypothetical protein